MPRWFSVKLRVFSRTSWQKRWQWLAESCALTSESLSILQPPSSFPAHLVDRLIENAIGVLNIPLGLIPTIKMNQETYTVPLATEETSVLAALHKTALWVHKKSGHLSAKSVEPQQMIGQIQIPKIQNLERLEKCLQEQKSLLIARAHAGPAQAMNERGGGVQDLLLRKLKRPDGQLMGIIHVLIDVQNAMGANMINQVCEFLRPLIADATGESMGIAILSNLADRRLTRAHLSLPGVSENLGKAIEEASLFSQLDPYRAATHNKGILNGIDGVVLATGNDGRAVSAALHAYAAASGTYRGLSTWHWENGTLEGVFKGPIPLGIIGGVTQLNPVTNLCLKILGVQSTQELAQVTASVGLLQNLGALRALVTDGITRGHMALHVDNLLMAEDREDQSKNVRFKIRQTLKKQGYLSSHDIQKHLPKKTNREDS